MEKSRRSMGPLFLICFSAFVMVGGNALAADDSGSGQQPAPQAGQPAATQTTTPQQTAPAVITAYAWKVLGKDVDRKYPNLLTLKMINGLPGDSKSARAPTVTAPTYSQLATYPLLPPNPRSVLAPEVSDLDNAWIVFGFFDDKDALIDVADAKLKNVTATASVIGKTTTTVPQEVPWYRLYYENQDKDPKNAKLLLAINVDDVVHVAGAVDGEEVEVSLSFRTPAGQSQNNGTDQSAAADGAVKLVNGNAHFVHLNRWEFYQGLLPGLHFGIFSAYSYDLTTGLPALLPAMIAWGGKCYLQRDFYLGLSLAAFLLVGPGQTITIDRGAVLLDLNNIVSAGIGVAFVESLAQRQFFLNTSLVITLSPNLLSAFSSSQRNTP